MIITPSIAPPFNCTVVGYLYDSDDPEDLGQTMAEVKTGTGVLVNVGWMPEGDPNGCYVVTATAGMHQLFKPYKTTDIVEANHKVEELARFYSGRPTLSAASNTNFVEVVLPSFSDTLDLALPGTQVYEYGKVA